VLQSIFTSYFFKRVVEFNGNEDDDEDGGGGDGSRAGSTGNE
jgi:hypothetical protein